MRDIYKINLRPVRMPDWMWFGLQKIAKDMTEDVGRKISRAEVTRNEVEKLLRKCGVTPKLIKEALERGETFDGQ